MTTLSNCYADNLCAWYKVECLTMTLFMVDMDLWPGFHVQSNTLTFLKVRTKTSIISDWVTGCNDWQLLLITQFCVGKNVPALNMSKSLFFIIY